MEFIICNGLRLATKCVCVEGGGVDVEREWDRNVWRDWKSQKINKYINQA